MHLDLASIITLLFQFNIEGITILYVEDYMLYFGACAADTVLS